MTHSHTTLNGLLSIWEDVCFFRSILDTYKGKDIKKLSVTESFRQDLLRCGKSNRIDVGKYDLNHLFEEDSPFSTQYRQFSTVPYSVLDWVSNSRRVFSLSSQMQHAFENISVGQFSSDDVRLPFGSFIIELAEPIISCDQEFSHIYVGDIMKYVNQTDIADNFEDTQLSAMSIMLLSKEFAQYEALSASVKKRLRRNIRPGDSSSFGELVTQAMSDKIGETIHYPFYMFRIATRMPLEDTGMINRWHKFGEKSETDSYDRYDCMYKVLRIISNLCIYLTTISSPDSANAGTKSSDWVKPRVASSSNLRVITNGMEVCDISAYHTLQEMSERDDSTGTSGETQSPHWRRGHFRRKPGEGNNPDAPKSVWVKPTLVNAHLIPEIGLPMAVCSYVA